MSQTTIEILPPEILTIILENLSFSEMKDASLVCRYWNEIVSCSVKFLNKSKIKIKDFEPVYARAYRSFHIIGDYSSYYRKTRKFLMKIIEFQPTLKHLHVSIPHIRPVDCINILKSCLMLDEFLITSYQKKRFKSEYYNTGDVVLQERHFKVLEFHFH
jgi:hypothetical protein